MRKNLERSVAVHERLIPVSEPQRRINVFTPPQQECRTANCTSRLRQILIHRIDENRSQIPSRKVVHRTEIVGVPVERRWTRQRTQQSKEPAQPLDRPLSQRPFRERCRWKTGDTHQDDSLDLRQLSRGQPDCHATSKRVSNEHDGTTNPIAQPLFNQIGVLHGVPVRGRSRHVAKTRQVDQMHAVRCHKQRTDGAKAVAASTPAVQADEVARCGVAKDFVDQRDFAQFGVFDVGPPKN